ncbi:unnamed protein product [Phyllotreta striolata]|uniref:Calcitonin receptor n=1 Tax=Phyllotreta striolata TaxID=444603 RepID=A0A9N9TJ74_PHYSR|nr:unnamed protein product [Phyllotreta striolata]
MFNLLDEEALSQLNQSKVYLECGKYKNTTPGYCPEVFDTLVYLWAGKEICWAETPPGTIANHSCPAISIFNQSESMFKECLQNGSWYMNNMSIPYVDYSKCFIMSPDDYSFLQLIIELTVIGYAISTTALVISLIIFFSFRSLKCTRIRIHTQLFISFVLNNITWILWYEEVIPYLEVTLMNPLWCQLLHVIREYFMIANYMWMFCEGLHLHLALVVVFVREERTIKWFYGLGWGLPVLIVGVHNLVRYFYTKDTNKCWMDESPFSHWFLSIPVLIILGVCTAFLLNVLRVILTIMRPNSSNPAPVGIRRAVRAALILIPLFGIQYILLPIVPEPGHPLYRSYMWLTLIIVPFQGLCCACLFCFANHDVRQALKGCFYNLRHRDTRYSSYRYTGAADSGGVYLVNGGSLHRKSTVTTKL